MVGHMGGAVRARDALKRAYPPARAAAFALLSLRFDLSDAESPEDISAVGAEVARVVEQLEVALAGAMEARGWCAAPTSPAGVAVRLGAGESAVDAALAGPHRFAGGDRHGC